MKIGRLWRRILGTFKNSRTTTWMTDAVSSGKVSTHCETSGMGLDRSKIE